MTLTIVNHYTHEKTFTIFGRPNGVEKVLASKGFVPNPRTQACPIPTDGSQDFSDNSSPPLKVGLKVREPSDIFGEAD